jgi:uncharacterized membrane protein
MSGGFIRGSFYPFFPWDQRRYRTRSSRSAEGLTNNQTSENDPESILKLRLARGEITPENYSYLLNLLSKSG